MTIKLFATDLDGTLLRPDHTVSDFTRDTIRRAVDAGIKVVFATGRPTRWLPPVIEETMHNDTIIAANGALIVDGKPGKLLMHGRLINHLPKRRLNYCGQEFLARYLRLRYC